MKGKLRYPAVLLLTAAVCLGAVLLPARWMEWRDQWRWFDTCYLVSVTDSNVSFHYDLTTAERVALFAEYLEFETAGTENALDFNTSSELSPSEDEISQDQVLSILQEETSELTALGLLPALDWDLLLSEPARRTCELTYFRLVDWDDPQRKLSLWTVFLNFYSPAAYKDVTTMESDLIQTLSCVMDAETGKLYLLSFYGTGPAADRFQAEFGEESLRTWGDYLELTAPTVALRPSEDNELSPFYQLTFADEDPAIIYYAAAPAGQALSYFIYTPYYPQETDVSYRSVG